MISNARYCNDWYIRFDNARFWITSLLHSASHVAKRVLCCYGSGIGQKNPALVALKKRYTVIMIYLTVASTAVAIVAGAFVIQGSERPETGTFYAGIVPETVAVLIPIVASIILVLADRHRVAEIKKERGWVAVSHQMTAIVVEEDVPRAIPFAWSLVDKCQKTGQCQVPLVKLRAATVNISEYDRLPREA